MSVTDEWTVSVCWITLLEGSRVCALSGSEEPRCRLSSEKWAGRRDNSVGSYHLHASETQQLSYVAEATPIFYLCGVARAHPITGQLATPLATQRLRYRLSAEKWRSLFGGMCTLQKLVSVEQKSQQYRQELAQVKKDLHKAQQEGCLLPRLGRTGVQWSQIRFNCSEPRVVGSSWRSFPV